MTTAAMRAKLNDYISVADDDKIKAMYVLFKNDINSELEWWQDKHLVKEFDVDYKNWKEGKVKGHSLDEVKASIKKLQVKRDAR
ncbi:hypothetical protein [Flavipsychrobacter stenotrophus]|nr:hypothetical protein [Flavipsychrobacter stenotrophus]